MANRERGESTFQVGDTTYTLKLTCDAMAQLEDACSTDDKPMTFPDIVQRMLKGSVKYTRLVIWASLQEFHPGLDIKAVGKLIDKVGGISGMWDVMRQLNDTSKPDAEDADPPSAPAQAVG